MCANHTSRLQAWLEENPEGTIGDIYNRWTPEMTIRTICHVLSGLEKAGKLNLGNGGRYSYRHRPCLENDKQKRIWAVIRGFNQVKPKVTVKEVAMVAGASPDYTGRYMSYLARAGCLHQSGKGLYRVSASAPLEAPRWTRRLEEREAKRAEGD